MSTQPRIIERKRHKAEDGLGNLAHARILLEVVGIAVRYLDNRNLRDTTIRNLEEIEEFVIKAQQIFNQISEGDN